MISRKAPRSTNVGLRAASITPFFSEICESIMSSRQLKRDHNDKHSMFVSPAQPRPAETRLLAKPYSEDPDTGCNSLMHTSQDLDKCPPLQRNCMQSRQIQSDILIKTCISRRLSNQELVSTR